jgi:hypothetical protein
MPPESKQPGQPDFDAEASQRAAEELLDPDTPDEVIEGRSVEDAAVRPQPTEAPEPISAEEQRDNLEWLKQAEQRPDKQ